MRFVLPVRRFSVTNTRSSTRADPPAFVCLSVNVTCCGSGISNAFAHSAVSAKVDEAVTAPRLNSVESASFNVAVTRPASRDSVCDMPLGWKYVGLFTTVARRRNVPAGAVKVVWAYDLFRKIISALPPRRALYSS